MMLYRITLTAKTAFATGFKGDTLFGQCCWAIRNLHGGVRLVDLLGGYTDQRPFLVLSDPLPAGYFQRPNLPLDLLGLNLADSKQRKLHKAKRWVPESSLVVPLSQWVEELINDKELGARAGLGDAGLLQSQTRQHNSLNRLTGTTGAGEAGFAPFDRDLLWYHPNLKLAIFAVLDEGRFSAQELQDVLQAVGQQGYGKEASSGCGKFEIWSIEPYSPPVPPAPDAWLTLAPCLPQGLAWQAEQCYYEVFTRFGRHGDRAVHTGKPFKNPVLMAQSFAVLTPAKFNASRLFTGRGVDGLSKAPGFEATVQQGYSPVIPVQLKEARP